MNQTKMVHAFYYGSASSVNLVIFTDKKGYENSDTKGVGGPGECGR